MKYTCTVHVYLQPGHFCQGHGPVIDGPGGFLPDHPLTQRENGDFSQVPLMSGYNSEDGSIYVIWCQYINHLIL